MKGIKMIRLLFLASSLFCLSFTSQKDKLYRGYMSNPYTETTEWKISFTRSMTTNNEEYITTYTLFGIGGKFAVIKVIFNKKIKNVDVKYCAVANDFYHIENQSYNYVYQNSYGMTFGKKSTYLQMSNIDKSDLVLTFCSAKKEHLKLTELIVGDSEDMMSQYYFYLPGQK